GADRPGWSTGRREDKPPPRGAAGLRSGLPSSGTGRDRAAHDAEGLKPRRPAIITSDVRDWCLPGSRPADWGRLHAGQVFTGRWRAVSLGTSTASSVIRENSPKIYAPTKLVYGAVRSTPITTRIRPLTAITDSPIPSAPTTTVSPGLNRMRRMMAGTLKAARNPPWRYWLHRAA